ncbi:hypothetical protein [uncultured Sphingomonas sp.]|uniref:hypothetical protein n=1 Tax=uncultured Sphingomonas sp. TaxID=158754 RepID=UPI0025F5F6FF|nr:hypothetical protein [uncultured Sphingomonas sp.]
MNDTASAGGASGASLIPSTTDAFTAAHLAIIAIFALLTIVAIIWGIRLKRQRRTAERDIAEHNAEVARTADETPAPTPEAPPPPPPAAPSPVTTPPVTTPAAQATDPEPAATDPIADEPIAASAPLDAAPAQEAASAPAAPAPVSADPAGAPVSTLKGLGPKLAARLGELGISTVGQVAALSPEQAAALDAQLGPFAGRMERDRWIEQARFLAAGDTAGFERVFGRL